MYIGAASHFVYDMVCYTMEVQHVIVDHFVDETKYSRTTFNQSKGWSSLYGTSMTMVELLIGLKKKNYSKHWGATNL